MSTDDALAVDQLYRSSAAAKFTYTTGDLAAEWGWRDPVGDDGHAANYLGPDGYLANIYNAQHCTRDWVVTMFFMKKIVAACGGSEVRSVHVVDDPLPSLHAMQHYLGQSWSWKVIPRPVRAVNVATLLNSATNCMVADHGPDYVDMAALATQLEDGCAFLYDLGSTWGADAINAVVLYALLFQRVELHRLGAIAVLFCTGKKQMDSGPVYKKLRLLAGTRHNLFSIDFIRAQPAVAQILDMQKNNSCTPFAEVLDAVEAAELQYNTFHSVIKSMPN